MAQRLREAREAAGFLSAKDAARALRLADSTYTQHENATRGFPVAKARRYAVFFKVNIDWLVNGRGTPKGRSSIDTLYGELDERNQEQARQYLEFLRSQQSGH